MSERRLRLELRPSWRLAVVIVASHGAAALAAALSLPALPGAAIAAGLVGLGALSARRVALLASPAAVRRLELEGPKAIVTLASGRSFAAPVAPRRYVSRLLVAIVLGAPARRTLIVTPDMLGPDSFRSLRVWALWGKLPTVAAKQLVA